MGGTTQTQNSAGTSNTSATTGGTANSSGNSTSGLTPGLGLNDILTRLVGGIGGINPNLTPQEQQGIAQLNSWADIGNPFKTGISNLATTLLGPRYDFSGPVNMGLADLQKNLAPT